MSEQQPPDQSEPQPPKKSAGSTIRLIVMLLILAVLGGGMAYDFAVARPAQKEANETVKNLMDQNKKMADVHAALDKEPAETRKDEYHFFEKYEWRGGLLVTTHKFYVTYAMSKMIDGVEPTEPANWANAEVIETVE